MFRRYTTTDFFYVLFVLFEIICKIVKNIWVDLNTKFGHQSNKRIVKRILRGEQYNRFGSSMFNEFIDKVLIIIVGIDFTRY